MNLLGLPLFGVILPFVGRRRIPMNRDGSVVDTGHVDMTDEAGPFYVEPVVFEWLGYGRPLTKSLVFDARTGSPVPCPWADA